MRIATLISSSSTSSTPPPPALWQKAGLCAGLRPEKGLTRLDSSLGANRMSTPVPEVFKIFSLHRYFLWAITMQDHYERTGKRFSPTPGFFRK
jgi:hypothetical protein